MFGAHRRLVEACLKAGLGSHMQALLLLGAYRRLVEASWTFRCKPAAGEFGGLIVCFRSRPRLSLTCPAGVWNASKPRPVRNHRGFGFGFGPSDKLQVSTAVS
eukprot:gnl/TRDRNA2_/TRDRNA2_59993_c0_seq1.p1 gnl/TRDRNA2_/TRDRNA2_59993_c0~~gnl/TRDRNA2_/TRDRNA2_59993_c0_seq1.p1  ORF type:complete len:103 (-),score=10.28 gnl/TRDRNA2_/TRDRNA2_59993_c0_seq1:97-405(-)